MHSLLCDDRNPDLPIDPETGEPIEAELPNDVSQAHTHTRHFNFLQPRAMT